MRLGEYETVDYLPDSEGAPNLDPGAGALLTNTNWADLIRAGGDAVSKYLTAQGQRELAELRARSPYGLYPYGVTPPGYPYTSQFGAQFQQFISSPLGMAALALAAFAVFSSMKGR